MLAAHQGRMLNRVQQGSGARMGAAVHLATLGPIGHSPVAPGTAGSVVGVILAVMIQRVLPARYDYEWVAVAVICGLYFCGVWAAGRAEGFYGSTDPGAVVIDEVAGQIIAFLLLPPLGWISMAVGFVLFRFFDVLKPFPARRAERLPGGWGIMTDDVIAGGYAAIALFLLGRALR